MDAESVLCGGLSDKLWTQVFTNLTVFQLKQVRSVCRRWYFLVCGNPALMARFTVTTVASVEEPSQQASPPQEAQIPSLLAALQNYTSVRLVNVADVDLERTWPAVAANLQEFTIDASTVSVDTLLQMLRITPNLQKLTVIDRFCFRQKLSEPVNFKLDQLKYISLRVEHLGEALGVLQKICSKVTTFRIALFRGRANEQLLQFLGTMRSTLKELKLDNVYPDDEVVRKIVALDWEQLKCVSLHVRPPEDFHSCHNIQLDKLPNTVEQLRLVPFSVKQSQDLDQLRVYLPYLRCIRIETTLQDDSLIQLLATHAQKLVHLDINFIPCYSMSVTMNLTVYNNPNLTELSLAKVYLTRGTSLQFFQQSPNIRRLALLMCTFEVPHEMALSVAQLRHLQSLELRAMNDETAAEQLNVQNTPLVWHINQLKLGNCSFGCETLRKIFLASPRLTNLQVSHSSLAGNTVAAILGEFGATLRTVSLTRCRSVGDEVVEHVIEQCRHFDRLVLKDCRLSFAAKQRLRTELTAVQLRL